MKNEKFNKEIGEEIIPEGKGSALPNVQVDGDKNKVPEIHNPNGNNNGSKAGAIRGDEKETPPNKDEATSQSKKDADETKVETRGRKKLSDEEKLQRANERKSAQSNLMDDLSKYKTTQLPTTTPTIQAAPEATKIDLSKYVSGALLLLVIDSVFPTLVLKIASYIDIKYKNVSSKKLKLDKEEKEELEPLADEMIKTFFGYVPAPIAFFVCAGLLYASKLMALEDEDFKPKIKTRIEPIAKKPIVKKPTVKK